MPLFESEAKRLSSIIKPSSKPQTMNILESGTSVAPRQRPKGSSTIHYNSNALGLGLPPSPSPRNTLMSPMPNQYPVVEQFQANFPNITPAGFNASSNSNNNENEHVSKPTALTTVTTATSTSTAVSTLSNKPADINNTMKQPPEMLNSLFESTVYPDPFSDNSVPTTSQIIQHNIIPEIDKTATVTANSVSLTNTLITNTTATGPSSKLHGVGSYSSDRASTETSATISTSTFFSSPPPPLAVNSLGGTGVSGDSTSQKSNCHLMTTKAAECAGSDVSLSATSGHRRNVSDTSAFNK